MNAIVIYVLIGIAIAIPVYLTNKDSDPLYRWSGCAMAVLGWPAIVIWIAIGRLPGKRMTHCVWCGDEIGNWSNGKDKEIEAWRTHYLNDCKEHPLAKRIQAAYAVTARALAEPTTDTKTLVEIASILEGEQ